MPAAGVTNTVDLAKRLVDPAKRLVEPAKRLVDAADERLMDPARRLVDCSTMPAGNTSYTKLFCEFCAQASSAADFANFVSGVQRDTSTCFSQQWARADDGVPKCKSIGRDPYETTDLVCRAILGNSAEICCMPAKGPWALCDPASTKWDGTKCVATYDGVVKACKTARGAAWDWTCSSADSCAAGTGTGTGATAAPVTRQPWRPPTSQDPNACHGLITCVDCVTSGGTWRHAKAAVAGYCLD